MRADALAYADRLATSAIVLLRRGEKRGERTHALHDTLTEFRQLLVRVRFPARYLLLDLGAKLAVAMTAIAAGTALHAYDVPWAAIPVAGVLVGVLIRLKARPFPLPPPRLDTGADAEGDVETIVEEIGSALARAGGHGRPGRRFAHLQACYARAWDLVHWGRLPAYTPGQAAEYGGTASGEFGQWFAPFWTPAGSAHMMVHQYWQLSLHDVAARQRLARCDHALRYLSPVPHARWEIGARSLCSVISLMVTAFFGPLIGILAALPVVALVLSPMLASCWGHPPTRFRREDITGDDLYTRRHFAASPDPLLRELLGR